MDHLINTRFQPGGLRPMTTLPNRFNGFPPAKRPFFCIAPGSNKGAKPR